MNRGPMMMTFIAEFFRVAPESFGIVSAGMVALLAAIVITGFWEFVIQEIKLKRVKLKHGRQTSTGIGVYGATDAKGVQSSLRHFDRAVERLQKLDSNWMGDNPIDHVTQDLVSDLRRIWSDRSSAKEGSKDLPVLLHGKGSKEKFHRQRASLSLSHQRMNLIKRAASIDLRRRARADRIGQIHLPS